MNDAGHPSTVTDAGHERADRVAVALDAALVLGYALVLGAVLLLGLVDGPLRVVVAAPFLGFLPGYAVLAALFPESDGSDSPVLTTERLRRPGLAWFERCALAVPTTLAVLPVLALTLSFLRVPLETDAMLLALVGIVVLGTLVGLARRFARPADQRYALPLDRWRREARGAFLDTDSPLDAALNVALVVVIVLAMSGLAYGLAAPERGESYTEVAILEERNGTLVSGNYPETLVRGEPANVTLTVENQEGQEMDYTAVVVMERVRTTGDGLQVLERNELERVDLSVPDTETRAQQLSVTPRLLGNDLRLSVLVFHGDAPADPTVDAADEHLYLWVNVSATQQSVGPPDAPA